MNCASESTSSGEQLAGLAAYMPPALYGALSTLTQHVYAPKADHSVRSLMVTATQPGSGVSYIASCLSTFVAETFGTSLLADGQVLADLATQGTLPLRAHCTPVKHSRLCVLGKTEAANLTAKTGVSRIVIPFLSRSSLRNGVGPRTVMNSILRDFEYAVVDAPALSESKAAETLACAVDGIILVVVPHETDINAIAAARVNLTSKGGRFLGAIYNTSLAPSYPGLEL